MLFSCASEFPFVSSLIISLSAYLVITFLDTFSSYQSSSHVCLLSLFPFSLFSVDPVCSVKLIGLSPGVSVRYFLCSFWQSLVSCVMLSFAVCQFCSAVFLRCVHWPKSHSCGGFFCLCFPHCCTFPHGMLVSICLFFVCPTLLSYCFAFCFPHLFAGINKNCLSSPAFWVPHALVRVI